MNEIDRIRFGQIAVTLGNSGKVEDQNTQNGDQQCVPDSRQS